MEVKASVWRKVQEKQYEMITYGIELTDTTTRAQYAARYKELCREGERLVDESVEKRLAKKSKLGFG